MSAGNVSGNSSASFNGQWSDEMNWNFLDKYGCSFKSKNKPQNFCRHEYNVTGICQKASCPLSNSIYATVKELEDNQLYLCILVPENKNKPNKLWKKIKLDTDKEKAMQTINENMPNYTKWLKSRCKHRYVRLSEYIARRTKGVNSSETLIALNRKREKQEKIREGKALVASKLHKTIQNELSSRLKSGYYGDMYKVPNEKIAEEQQKDEELNILSSEDEYIEGDLTDDEFEVDIEDLASLYSIDKPNKEKEAAKKRVAPLPKAKNPRKKIKQSIND